MRPEIIIIDCSTGEQTIREMNDEEYAQHLIDQQAYADSLIQQEANETETL